MVAQPAENHESLAVIASSQETSLDHGRGSLPLAADADHLTADDQFQRAIELRDWLFPGADELFRSIYTSAGTGANEVLAVSSAIAGEGMTTLSLGLGLTIAQDY